MSLPTAHSASVIPKPLRTELGRSLLLEGLSQLDMPVMALLAPSGYGKTTLLAQYVRSSSRRTVWLTLSESDSDMAFFVASLRGAWAGHLEGTESLSQAPEHFIQGLLRALSETEHSIDLVLDRVEVLGPDAGRLLSTLLLHLPEGHRVLLSGFNSDYLPLARLIAAGRAVVIDQLQLAFSEHESRMLLEARGYGGDARQVTRSLEGWPAGTALVASGAGLSVEPRDLVFETLATLSPALQCSLPEASVLPVWSVDEAQGALALPPGWLDEVRRVGLPLTPLGQGLYRPHQLLLSALSELLKRTPERGRTLHRWRSEQCAAAGDPLAAIRHAKSAGDWQFAADLLGSELPRLYARNEFALIRSLTHDLPWKSLPAWITEYRAAALTETGDVELGEAPLRALYERGEASAVGYTALTLLAVRRGQIGEQLRLAEEGMIRFAPEQTFSLRLQRVSALTSLARVDEGLSAGEALVAEARGRGAHLDEARALVMLQYVHQVLGQWAARESCLRAAHALFTALNQRVRDIETLSMLSEIEAMAGRSHEAHALLDLAVQAAETEQPIMVAPLRAARALVYLAQGNAVQADQELVAALGVVEALHLDMQRPFLHLLRFDTLLGLQRPSEAQQALASAATLPLPLVDDYLAFYHGRWAFATSQFQDAASAFDQVVAQYPDRFRQVRARAYQCELARQRGQLTNAQLDQLSRALDGLDPGAVLALDHEALRELTSEAARRIPGHPLAVLGSGRTEVALSARTVIELGILGRLEVRLGERAIRMPLQKSGELLVWLAWHGEGRLTQLLDALWDGSNDPKHHEYFRVAVRRLRARLVAECGLAFDPIPYDGRLYRISPELEVRIDARQWLSDLASPDLGVVGAALERPKREVLLDIEAEWIQPLREEVRSAGLRAVLGAATALAQATPAAAADIYRQALRLQPDSEALYGALVQVLSRTDSEQARQEYHNYVRMMRQEYGASPSQTMCRLAATLDGNAPSSELFPADSQHAP